MGIGHLRQQLELQLGAEVVVELEVEAKIEL